MYGTRQFFTAAGNTEASYPGLARSGLAARFWNGIVGALLLLIWVGAVDAAGVAAQRPPNGPSFEHRPPPGQELPRLRRPEVRQDVSARMALKQRQAKQAAWEVAIRQGWQPWGQFDNVYYELTAIKGGLVYVMKTLNVQSAISTTVDQIRDVPPYELSGAGQTAGVWDGGSARASHQEFPGRVVVEDDSRPVDHSTHVTGTIAAGGTKARALGLAPDVNIESFDFDEDLAEVALLAMSRADEPDKIQISNHSYGWIAGWDNSGFLPAWYGTWGQRESELFGSYDETARDWDALCYAAPYYLPFKAAGNDRGDGVPRPGERFEYYTDEDGWQLKQYDLNTDPYPDAWDLGGYDTLPADATAKNTVTVGAIDLSNSERHDLTLVKVTDFSSWGPTDDGRIKPDLVAHGVDVYSTTAGSDRSYDVFSGSSMATAAASGAAVLLPEFYARFSPDRAARSATIKALLIHTADDLGNPGPDYRFGWGLINAKAAVDHIQMHFDFPDANAIVEDVVDVNVPIRTYSFISDGTTPIRATLVWTDPPGAVLEGLDNPTLCLVNDLDMRVVDPNGTIYMPFVLVPSRPDEPATTGDNKRDNVEQVLIEAPLVAAQYRIEITHKATLVNGRQEYSLLLNGQRLGQIAGADPNGDDTVD